MSVCGWKYVYDGFSSKTFPDWGSAVRDLIARFPDAARFPEYYVRIEPERRSARFTPGVGAGRGEVRPELLQPSGVTTSGMRIGGAG